MLRALDSFVMIALYKGFSVGKENKYSSKEDFSGRNVRKLYEKRSGYTICVECNRLNGIRKVNNLYMECKQFVYIIES